MIIEIKDLPTDRKVKHITFDITFEEDGTPIVNSMPITSQPIIQQPNTSNLNFPSTQEGPNPRSIESRLQKEVPPEMTDLEF